MFHQTRMRVADEKLVYLALRALEDALDEAQNSPVKRTFAIRLALAYLASRSSGARWPFDQFWQWMPHEERKGRFANMTCALNGIYLQVGKTKSIEQG